MWRLPLDEEYRELIRSNIADIIILAAVWWGDYGGDVLKEFVEDTPGFTSILQGRPGLRMGSLGLLRGLRGICASVRLGICGS